MRNLGNLSHGFMQRRWWGDEVANQIDDLLDQSFIVHFYSSQFYFQLAYEICSPLDISVFLFIFRYFTIILETTGNRDVLGNITGLRTFRVLRALKTVSIVPGLTIYDNLSNLILKQSERSSLAIEVNQSFFS